MIDHTNEDGSGGGGKLKKKKRKKVRTNIYIYIYERRVRLQFICNKHGNSRKIMRIRYRQKGYCITYLGRGRAYIYMLSQQIVVLASSDREVVQVIGPARTDYYIYVISYTYMHI